MIISSLANRNKRHRTMRQLRNIGQMGPMKLRGGKVSQICGPCGSAALTMCRPSEAEAAEELCRRERELIERECEIDKQNKLLEQQLAHKEKLIKMQLKQKELMYKQKDKSLQRKINKYNKKLEKKTKTDLKNTNKLVVARKKLIDAIDVADAKQKDINLTFMPVGKTLSMKCVDVIRQTHPARVATPPPTGTPMCPPEKGASAWKKFYCYVCGLDQDSAGRPIDCMRASGDCCKLACSRPPCLWQRPPPPKLNIDCSTVLKGFCLCLACIVCLPVFGLCNVCYNIFCCNDKCCC